jgi:N-acetylmuramoyl-L-alanine amidase
MSLYRKFLAGAFGACLASGSAVAFVAAQAEPVPGQAAAMIAAETQIQMAPVQPSAQPAAPAAVALPSAVAVPAPAPAPAPRAQPAVEAEDGGSQVSEAELACLTRVILYEAGAESRSGQLAVAQVVLNRARSGRFPRTICGVINQRGQFASIRSFNAPGGARWERAEDIAEAALEGERAPGIGSALFFHAAHVRPFSGRTRVARLGNHIFYR